jgi:hypothetical protein
MGTDNIRREGPPDREASRAKAAGFVARHGDLGWAVAVGLVGLALRVACARQYAGDPLGRFAWIDEQAYAGRARAILAGHLLPDRPFYQDPLYPYLLAALMVVVGDSVATLRVALAALGALTPVAVLWAGRTGLGRAEGIVAGWAAALYGPFIVTDMGLEKEGPGALLAAVALGLSAKGARRPSVATAAVSGLAWGALALLRSNALVVGPIGAAWWAWGVPRREGARWTPRPALAFATAFALSLAPAVAINAIVSRPAELLITTWQAGPNFYIGNGPEATGTMADIPFVAAHPFFEADDYAREARRRAGRALSPGEVSRFWFAEGLRRWRAEPVASLRLLGRKAFLLANDHEVADNHDGRFIRLAAAPALAWGALSFGWIAPWAALGLGVPREVRSPFWWLLVVTTAAGLAATMAFFVVGRYRIPWTPGLILLGAAGAVDLVRRLSSRRWRGAALRLLFLATPAAAMAWAPTPVPADDRWGLALRRQFKALLWSGEVDAAIDALDDARALGPRPMRNLAAMMAAGPEHDLMATLLADAPVAGDEPPGIASDLRRARWLRQVPEGRAESRHLLEAILRDHPDDPAALREWGAWWLGEVRDPDARARAASALRRAAEGPPGDPSAAILLALLASDRRALDDPALLRADGPRLRVARAILTERPRRPPGGPSPPRPGPAITPDRR